MTNDNWKREIIESYQHIFIILKIDIENFISDAIKDKLKVTVYYKNGYSDNIKGIITKYNQKRIQVETNNKNINIKLKKNDKYILQYFIIKRRNTEI